MLFFQRSRSQNFRSLEWIYLTVHFGMWLTRPDVSLAVLLGFYGLFLLLGWLPPWGRSWPVRLLYIVAGLTTTIVARCYGLDLVLFLFFYFVKSDFLLNRRSTIGLCYLTALPWTVSDYFGQMRSLPLDDVARLLHRSLGTLAVYTAASIFTLMFCGMLRAEEESRYQIDELSEQVESLAIALERTRIAREIHDSLGHTLTDLDTQLAVAQTLRAHDLPRSFQAVDTAKLLARQCIEDVSQALDQMRQSDFDLNQALIGLVEQLRQSSGIQVKWQINLPQFSVYRSYQVYCIAKEILMNVQKHANASEVLFNTTLVAEGIRLELKDNGIGFDPGQFTTGFGLQGVIERVQLLGGNCDITTACNQGTHIQILLPQSTVKSIL
jgi:signal transduction histidine kinase